MKRTVLWSLILSVFVAVFVSAADWVVLKDDEYGFAMLMPQGTKTKSKAFGNGWGGGYAKYGVTEFFGIAKKNVQASPREIEEFAVNVSGVAAHLWKRIDEGRNVNGWKWWRTYRASNDTHVVFAVLGTGRRGSYCIFLRTTIEDFNSGSAAYERWYKSLTLY